MKIIYYDSWTRGASFFKLYDDILSNYDVETKLIHFGSITEKYLPIEFKNSNNQKAYQKVNGIKCYDYTFYQTKDLLKILESEKPDYILVINYNHLFIRIIIETANLLKIPVIYSMHGVIGERNKIKINNKIKYVYENLFSKIKKYLIMLGLYIKVRNHYVKKFDKKTILYLFQLFTRPSKTIVKPFKQSIVNADYNMVFTQKDKDYFIDKMGYSKENTYITGSPFIQSSFDSTEQQAVLSKYGKYILLVDQVFLESKLFTIKQFSRLIEEMSIILSRYDLRLLIKLHPKSIMQNYLRFNSDNVFITQDYNTNLLVRESEGIMAVNSTVISTALSLRKKILLIKTNKKIRISPYDIFSKKIVIHDYSELASKMDYFLTANSEDYSLNYNNYSVKEFDNKVLLNILKINTH